MSRFRLPPRSPRPESLAVIALGGLALAVSPDARATEPLDLDRPPEASASEVREVEVVETCVVEVEVEAVGDVERGWIVDFSRVDVGDLELNPTDAVVSISSDDPNAAHAYVSECSELEVCDEFTTWRDAQVAGGEPVQLVADGPAAVSFVAPAALNADAGANAARLLAAMTKLATACSTS